MSDFFIEATLHRNRVYALTGSGKAWCFWFGSEEFPLQMSLTDAELQALRRNEGLNLGGDLMSLKSTDAECATNAKAPRVSLADIESEIVERHDLNAGEALRTLREGHEGIRHEHASLHLLSLCLLVMRNGFVAVGKSAPASPENFNQALGTKLAYEDAVRQLWPLMGYALRGKLAAKEVAGK